MAYYDYKAGKKRVKEILDNKLEVIEQNKIPKDENFTFDNSYHGWVSAVFVDIRDSSDIFSKEDKVEVSKMIRSFTSEIIEILRGDDNEREIGIRGDCVYAIYATPQKDDIYEIFNKSCLVNTYMKMLNKLLTEKGYSEIQIGIGIATSKELVIKAGRKGVGINNSVWIGDAVTKASNLSGLGNKDGLKSMVCSDTTYINIIDRLVKQREDAKKWFTERSDSKYGLYYDFYLINSDFNTWIDDGMLD